jgi:hypothetical protein
MSFDESNEIRGSVPRQRGFGEVGIRGYKILRVAIQIGEIAASAAGDQNLFAGTLAALQNGHTAPAFAGFDGAEESRGSRAKHYSIKFVDHCMG